MLRKRNTGYGAANITPQVCLEYDDFYITTRQEIEAFNGWYECSLDPNCDPAIDYPNFQTPSSIIEWPGNFNPLLDNTNTYDFNLAPFFDRNGDLVYDPLDGDYPWYDLTGEIDCRTSEELHYMVITICGGYSMIKETFTPTLVEIQLVWKLKHALRLPLTMR